MAWQAGVRVVPPALADASGCIWYLSSVKCGQKSYSRAGLCSAGSVQDLHTGWMGCASPLYKGPLFPSELLARQAGHGKAQPKEPTQQHPCEDGAAAPGFAALP